MLHKNVCSPHYSSPSTQMTAPDPSIKLLKFADGTTVISLIQDGDESANRRDTA